MICLHIGYPKSGTTTLQAFLDHNAEALARHGIIYPSEGQRLAVASHHPLTDAIEAGRLDELEPILRRARAHPDATVVVSSEGLPRLAPEVVRAAFGDLPVRVMAYQRNVGERAVSAYKQRAKHGHCRDDFDVFLETWMAEEAATWAMRLTAWGAVFGPQAVRLRPAENDALAKGAVIADFLSALGLDAAAQSGLEPLEPQNVSPGWRAVELIRWFAVELAQSPGLSPEAARRTAGGPVRKALNRAETDAGLYDRGLYLTREQARRLAARNAEDAAILSAAGLDAVAPRMDADAVTPRAFLPEAAAIEPEARAILVSAAALELARKNSIRVAEKVARKAVATAQD